jgi:hypothetical protein
MFLRLEEVMFNHDPSSATNDALNIRRNETDFVTVPEWRRGITTTPEDSPAAYAIEETRGKTITIRARFSCAEGGTPELEVRALDARLDPARGFQLKEQGPVGWLLRYHLRNLAGNVLGEVAAKSVPACRGETGFVTFELKDVRIWDVGVGAHDVAWRWQYRLPPDGDWTGFDTSAHRIYTVLKTPEPPWQQQHYEPSNTLLPWADALDRACAWAAGAKDADAAAELVTRAANDLGAGLLHYTGDNQYTDSRHFDCQAFLDRLGGKVGNGSCVNCDDCAAIVYTFSNILGCSLTRMSIEPVQGQAYFSLKPIIKIGIPGWRDTGKFVHHCVAAEGHCRDEDEVFDACVQVSTVDEPKPQSRIPLLPANLRFGRAGESFYRSRLVLPEFEDKCRVDAADCDPLRPGPARLLAPHCENLLALTKEQHAFGEWALSDAAGVRRFVLDYFFADYTLPGWRPVQLRQFPKGLGAEEPHAVQSFWNDAQRRGDYLVRVDVFECDSWRDAREGVAALLTWFKEGDVTRRISPELGDVVFADGTFGAILLAVGNLVFSLRSRGRNPDQLVRAAVQLNGAVLNPPPGIISEDFRPGEAVRFRFAGEDVEVGSDMLIVREAVDPLARRRLYQFFSDDGEVSLRGESLLYRPRVAGVNVLEIFAVDAQGNALRQKLRLKAR